MDKFSKTGVIVDSARDEVLWSAMKSLQGKMLFKDTRKLIDGIAVVRANLERHLGVTSVTYLVLLDAVVDAAQGAAVSPFVRAGTLIKSFTCLICMWRDLGPNEERKEIVSKAVRTLCVQPNATKGSYRLGPWPPHYTVTKGLSVFLGIDTINWDEPFAKRR